VAGNDPSGGRSGNAGNPPSEAECLRLRDGLDRGCATNDDCYLGTWARCGMYSVSEVLGLSAAGLAELESAAALCGNPRVDSDCPVGEGNGYLSRDRLDDGIDRDVNQVAAVECVEGSCRSYVTFCGHDLCGNGVVDACEVGSRPQPTFTPVATVPPGSGATEHCDGTNFGGVTCVDLGWASGELRCVEGSCATDTTGCSVCPDAGTSGVTCVAESDQSPPDELDAAASENEVAVLYLRDLELHLARYDSELELRSDIVFDLGDIDTDPSFLDARIGRGPERWEVLVASAEEYRLYSVSDDGEIGETYRSARRLSKPVLVSRPDGGPAVGDTSNVVELIADDLRSVRRSVELLTPPLAGGAWVGEDLLMVGLDVFQPVVWHVDAETSAITENRYEAPSAAGSEDVLIQPVEGGAVLLHDVWSERAVYYRRLDARGAQVGDTLDLHPGDGLAKPGKFAMMPDGALAIPFHGSTANGPQGAWLARAQPGGDPGSTTLLAAQVDRASAFALADGVVVVFSTLPDLGPAGDRGIGLASVPF
jgi:hypothetical protein